LGPGHDEVRELSFLGRSIRWTEEGIVWSGDTKQAQQLVTRAGLDGDKGRKVDTPGVKVDADQGSGVLLEGEAATDFRSLTALANYICQDRVDLSFAAKETSQRMARPEERDVLAIKRIARYLRQYPTCSYFYRWQETPTQVTVYTDSDWGGCARTRRSTSGGCVFLGSHLLCHWARTQQAIALSSCEAELNAMNKGSTEGIGILHMCEQCGLPADLVLRTDASAARGVVERVWAGKVKHLSVKQLWTQDLVSRGILKVQKVLREVNVADSLTHHWTSAEGAKFFPSRMLCSVSIR